MALQISGKLQQQEPDDHKPLAAPVSCGSRQSWWSVPSAAFRSPVLSSSPARLAAEVTHHSRCSTRQPAEAKPDSSLASARPGGLIGHTREMVRSRQNVQGSGRWLPDLAVGPAVRVLRPNLSVLVRNPVVASLLHKRIPLLRPLSSGELPSSGRPCLPNMMTHQASKVSSMSTLSSRAGTAMRARATFTCRS
jgi:hypothetical protein